MSRGVVKILVEFQRFSNNLGKSTRHGTQVRPAEQGVEARRPTALAGRRSHQGRRQQRETIRCISAARVKGANSQPGRRKGLPYQQVDAQLLWLVACLRMEYCRRGLRDEGEPSKQELIPRSSSYVGMILKEVRGSACMVASVRTRRQSSSAFAA